MKKNKNERCLVPKVDSKELMPSRKLKKLNELEIIDSFEIIDVEEKLDFETETNKEDCGGCNNFICY